MRSLSIQATGLAALFGGASLIAAEGTLVLVADDDHWDATRLPTCG